MDRWPKNVKRPRWDSNPRARRAHLALNSKLTRARGADGWMGARARWLDGRARQMAGWARARASEWACAH